MFRLGESRNVLDGFERSRSESLAFTMGIVLEIVDNGNGVRKLLLI